MSPARIRAARQPNRADHECHLPCSYRSRNCTLAAIRLDPSQEGWFSRSDVLALGSAITLGVLTHGVLDGLKHGYPLETMPDVLCAGVLAGCWCLCLRRRYFLLFTSVSLASFFPDIVDLGPR